VSGIAIYVEGGGQKGEPNTADAKADFRRGMNEFLNALRHQARIKAWHWKVVPCGDRDSTLAAFLNAREQEPHTHAILLVDAETIVTTPVSQHLATHDEWSLKGVDADSVHLMAVVMETWLVADPETLQTFYGQGFNPKALPAHAQLELADKAVVAASLAAATKGTQKGTYRKLRHGSELLRLINPAKVRSRCPHCELLFDSVGNLLR
jgi:hypothetical protein